ncbi:tetratricopeptide (TPR) repeat protein [Lewinella aquimaris]|uniref:Tetratricopeptide (TPR) repeat protein n=1 Tax=Neolewinella aquimaris TaxID=1835722 RepID=A0A840EAA7_9BACT|nr:tetratricopeptide repeat protein [Neolewinella aquimaris]MBB4080485.1 tetratricopeptide (TPR) repeat protein [Neolewinella aquimaris]
MARKNNIGRRPTGTPSKGRAANTNTGIGGESDGDDTLVDFVEVRDQGLDFFERNRKPIIIAVVALIAIVAGALLYQTFIAAPAERNAAEQMQQAQFQFDQDSFSLALTNPGQGYPGFLDIADEYSGTKAGNLANYYAAVSYLNLGKYEAAMDYLQDFDAEGELLPAMKAGVMGDLHSELGDFSAAIDSYREAVDEAGNNYVTGGYYLNKLGLLLRKEGRTEEALAAFRRLKADYSASAEAAQADKYITALESK